MRRNPYFFDRHPICLLPGGAAPAATQPAATQLPAIQPSATAEVPTEAPAATEPPASSGTETQVDITLVDNKIQSPVTTFQVGVPYTFVITNAGQRGHNFNISTPVSEAGSLEAALQTALLAVPQSELGPGASVTVELHFLILLQDKNWNFLPDRSIQWQFFITYSITFIFVNQKVGQSADF